LLQRWHPFCGTSALADGGTTLSRRHRYEGIHQVLEKR